MKFCRDFKTQYMSIILEDDENTEFDDTTATDDTSTDTTEDGGNENSDGLKENSDFEIQFSSNIAAEFGKECNKFTEMAAQAVKDGGIKKETAETMYKTLDKIKDLLDISKK